MLKPIQPPATPGFEPAQNRGVPVHGLNPRSRRWLVSAAAVAGLVAVAACTPASNAGDKPLSAKESAASTEAIQAAQAAMTKLYKGTNKEPDGEPVPATAGKKVFIISCGQQAAACAVPTQGAMDAAKVMGWNASVLDTAFVYSRQGSLIDQAIAAGADGIAMVGNDCSFSPAALERARTAHIPVANVYGADCDDPYSPGDPVGDDLWTDVPTAGFTTGPSFFQGMAVAKAQYIIAKTEGQARVLAFRVTDSPTVNGQALAFEHAMAKCGTCEVYDIPFKSSEFGPKLQQIAQQAVLQHPDATVVAPGADDLYLGGIQAGIKAAGGTQLFILGAEGTAPGMQMVKSGELGGELGFSADWLGWALADTMNSLLAGKAPRNSGAGWQAIDKAHNLSLVGAGGEYEPAIDYQSAYKKLWGVN